MSVAQIVAQSSMNDETRNRAKIFQSRCRRDPSNQRLQALKRKWADAAYGDAPTRVRILHEFDTYVAREKSESVYGVNYQVTGFKGHLGGACAHSEPLRPPCDVRVVSRPARGNTSCMHNLANALVRNTRVMK